MSNDNSTKKQRAKLLAWLRKKFTITTFEARAELDIVAPAPRVFELRHNFGFNIHTHWTEGINPGGGRHRVARYVLMPGKWQGGKE